MPPKILSQEDALAFLTRETVGHLATNDPTGYPYITPLNYVYYQGKIYFHCALKGRKLDNLAADNRVCFEVSRLDRKVFSPLACKCSTRYTSVLVFGRARLVEDPARQRELLEALTETYAQGQSFAAIEPDSPKLARCHVVEITIDAIHGKANVDREEL
jgi:nitroimidazol reductase NimA-like FMN-containing flavoprotein (pyridoxamine 5'-phosphate oxidase superfamily)